MEGDFDTGHSCSVGLVDSLTGTITEIRTAG